MRYALVLAVSGALIAAQIDRPAAQTTSEPAAQLSEQDKTVVIKAVVEAQSHQKTPKDFTPTVGATVPRSVYIHAFTPEIVEKVPVLKQYWYAYTDQEIALVDATKSKVVLVIPLPAKLGSTGQGDHGAAEPANESRRQGSQGGPAGSVPAYTSPETIK